MRDKLFEIRSSSEFSESHETERVRYREKRESLRPRRFWDERIRWMAAAAVGKWAKSLGLIFKKIKNLPPRMI